MYGNWRGGPKRAAVTLLLIIDFCGMVRERLVIGLSAHTLTVRAKSEETIWFGFGLDGVIE